MSFKFTIIALAGRAALCVIVNNLHGVINTFSTDSDIAENGLSCG